MSERALERGAPAPEASSCPPCVRAGALSSSKGEACLDVLGARPRERLRQEGRRRADGEDRSSGQLELPPAHISFAREQGSTVRYLQRDGQRRARAFGIALLQRPMAQERAPPLLGITIPLRPQGEMLFFREEASSDVQRDPSIALHVHAARGIPKAARCPWSTVGEADLQGRSARLSMPPCL